MKSYKQHGCQDIRWPTYLLLCLIIRSSLIRCNSISWSHLSLIFQRQLKHYTCDSYILTNHNNVANRIDEKLFVVLNVTTSVNTGQNVLSAFKAVIHSFGFDHRHQRHYICSKNLNIIGKSVLNAAILKMFGQFLPKLNYGLKVVFINKSLLLLIIVSYIFWLTLALLVEAKCSNKVPQI